MMSAPTSSVPIRVLIVDDHAVVREGIAALLGRQPDMVAVGEASDGAEAVARFVELAPDVTLMDMQMGEMGGVEAIERSGACHRTPEFLCSRHIPEMRTWSARYGQVRPVTCSRTASARNCSTQSVRSMPGAAR